jgi:hypothetical protein
VTKRTIDLDQVRVVQADNYKGNSRVYVEIMDVRVLYTDPWALQRSEQYSHYVTLAVFEGDLVVDTDGLADMFRAHLGRIFAKLLLAQCPDLMDGVWSTETDREIDYTRPRLEEDPDA